MLSVIYISVVDPQLERSDIESLVGEARTNNARDALTGALLYNGQNFMQLLEGPVGKVESCLARIRIDRRHSGMVELRRRLVDAREFPDFSMHYCPLFRDKDNDIQRIYADWRLDPQDERLIINFLALGRRGDAA